MSTSVKPLAMADYRGLSAIKAAREDNLRTIFANATIVYGALAKAKSAQSLRSQGKAVKKHASTLKTAVKGADVSDGLGPVAQAKAMIREAVGVDMPDLVQILTVNAIDELVQEMTPYLGLFRSSQKAAQAWRQIYEQTRAELAWYEYTQVVLPGDPLDACRAVKRLLARNLARSTAEASIHTTATATKIAGMAGDMGTGLTTTVIGLASGIASLAVQLTQLGIDIREMRAGNKLLANPTTLDKSVFAACPLVGSYLITRSPTSALLSFFVADVGLPGWMDKIEKFKKEGLDPIIEVATKQIERSAIKMEGVNVGSDPRYAPHEYATKKLPNLNRDNLRFQFNRLVLAKLPF